MRQPHSGPPSQPYSSNATYPSVYTPREYEYAPTTQDEEDLQELGFYGQGNEEEAPNYNDDREPNQTLPHNTQPVLQGGTYAEQTPRTSSQYVPASSPQTSNQSLPVEPLSVDQLGNIMYGVSLSASYQPPDEASNEEIYDQQRKSCSRNLT